MFNLLYVTQQKVKQNMDKLLANQRTLVRYKADTSVHL